MTVDGMTRQIADLPVMDELSDSTWGEDFSWITERLFDQPYCGPMRAPWGDLVVYGSDDIEMLRQHPSISHQTVQASVGHLEDAPYTPRDFIQLLGDSVFSMRAPEHRPEKMVLNKTLSPRSVANLRPVFGGAIHELIRDALDQDVVDFRADIAEPAVGAFWSSGLGMTEDETREAFNAASKMSQGFLLDPTLAQWRASDEGSAEFQRVILKALHRSAEAGGFPLVETLLDVHAGGGGSAVLSDPFERLTTALFDGFSSLPGLMANFAFTAADRQVDLSSGRVDPQGFASKFFLEATRLNPIVTMTVRQATADFVHRGLEVPADTNIIMLWLFGNRDPRYFDDPDRFELDRPNRVRQYTFGGGPYVCPGRNIAQALCEVMVAELAHESIALELAEPPVWVPVSTMHEVEHLPVRVRRS